MAGCENNRSWRIGWNAHQKLGSWKNAFELRERDFWGDRDDGGACRTGSAAGCGAPDIAKGKIEGQTRSVSGAL